LAGSHFLGPFPQFIPQFRQQRPAVEVVLKEMMPSDHLQALRDGQLDVSLSRHPLNTILSPGVQPAALDPTLSAALLWRDPVVVALPPDHRLAARARLKLADLRDEDFVFLRLDSSPFAARLYDACVQAGFAPRITQQVVEIPAVLNLVAAGLGVAIVPASLARLRTPPVQTRTLSRTPSPGAVEGGEENRRSDHRGQGLNGDVYVLGRTEDAAPAVAAFTRLLLDWAGTLAPPAGH